MSISPLCFQPFARLQPHSWSANFILSMLEEPLPSTYTAPSPSEALGPRKGAPASSQSVSRWIVQLIHLAYQLAKKPLPEGLKAHSTRAVSTSTALFKGVQLQNICKAATWATPLTFARHYRLDVRAKNDAVFGRAILSSMIP